jgi:hypothetical protein
MEKEMVSSHQRLLATAALVFAMSAIVALVVLSPIVWRAGSNPGPATEAVSAQDEVADVVAAPKPAPPAARTPDRQVLAQPASSPLAAFNAFPSGSPQAGEARPLKRPSAANPPAAVFDKKGKAKGHEKKGKAKGHDKKALGSKKTGKPDHHAQGAAGKGHGKGKSKDRDRAPARARG